MIPFNFYYAPQVNLNNHVACAKKHNRNYFLVWIALEQPTFFVHIFGDFNDAT